MEIFLVDFLREWSLTKDYITVVDGATDEDIVSMGNATCEAFDVGVTGIEVVQIILDGSLDARDQDDLAYVLGAAVEALCPEHSSKFD